MMQSTRKDLDHFENPDHFDSYFECITSCYGLEGENVECVTRCLLVHLGGDFNSNKD